MLNSVSYIFFCMTVILYNHVGKGIWLYRKLMRIPWMGRFLERESLESNGKKKKMNTYAVNQKMRAGISWTHSEKEWIPKLNAHRTYQGKRDTGSIT